MSYIISERLCPQNHRCPIIRVCSAEAIIQEGYRLPLINKGKCTECGKCIRYCPTGAILKEE